MDKNLILALCIAALAACSEEYVIQRTSDDPPFSIYGKIDPNVEQFRNGGSKVSAIVRIANETDQIHEFSTKWLWVRIPGFDPVRAYHDSVASHSIDVEPIEIDANTVAEIPVYWVLPTDNGTNINVEYVTLKFMRK